MNEEQLKDAIYFSFYRVVRVGQPLEKAVFFDRTIKDTWPLTPPPTDWSTFWYEAVALEMQQAFVDHGKYLVGFDGAWLKKNRAQKWQTLFDLAAADLMDYQDAIER
jgi:hypothetical protein